MATMDPSIEGQIREWRSYLLRRRTMDHVDIDELEDHLRSQISELGAAGLSEDESFLVAIKRIGGINELSREFARERSSRLWKQLVLAGDTVRERSGAGYMELAIMIGFAVAAAIAFKLPAAFGVNPFVPGSAEAGSNSADASFYLRTPHSWRCRFSLPFLPGSVISQFACWPRWPYPSSWPRC
jgi:hypothetical protein